MNARDKLNELKELWGLKTDNELAETLGVTKYSIDNWVKRDKISNEWLLKISQMTDKTSNLPTTTYTLPLLTIKASAGHGTDLISVDEFDTGTTMVIDKSFFKTPPKANLKVIQVDGYSMIPMLLPDSFVIFEETYKFDGDGLYVINYSNQLMVKLLQLTPNGILKIISKNKDYESYELSFKDNNEFFKIIGKVIKCIL